jgi:glycosyltransferase involved in cell wall biosynthesis
MVFTVQSHSSSSAKQSNNAQFSKGGMLLVLPAPFYVREGRLLFDSQACNGLERWADNFDHLTVAAPVIPEHLLGLIPVDTWRDTQTLFQSQRFKLVPLPWGYSASKFTRSYRATRQLLGRLVRQNRYLQFGIGGMIGDWASVAALEAYRQNRTYAVHTDWVEHQHVLQVGKQAPLLKQVKATVLSAVMKKYYDQIIGRANLGLLHGGNCFSAYSPLCANSYLIYDIHTKSSDTIASETLAEKVRRVASHEPLRICYAGRMEPMKAPLDWIRAIAHARDLGIHFKATWWGGGSLSDSMQMLINDLQLQSYIELPGVECDRSKLLRAMQDSHLMLFTHITSESPRCVIEALISGTPIVGYDSDYVQDLTQTRGGGAFVPVHDWQSLGKLIAELDGDRSRLSTLVRQAGENGKRFNDKAVFQERSALIKQHL